MNFLKSLKSKLPQSQSPQTAAQRNEKGQQKQKQKPKQKQSGYFNQINIKSLVSNIYHKFKQQDQSKPSNQEEVINYENAIIVQPSNNGRFWHIAPPSVVVTDNHPKQDEPSTINNTNTNQHELNPQQIIKQLQISQQSASQFIQNLEQSHTNQLKMQQQRVLQARNKILHNVGIQPIYMENNSDILSKIFIMELSYGLGENMDDRIIFLQNQRNNVQEAIIGVIGSGYLWKAYGIEHQKQDFITAVYQVIMKNMSSAQKLSNRIKQQKSKIHLFNEYYIKILQLNRKRTVIAKKLKLLQKIKSYKKDLSIKFQNIDQAFYIERSRQKVYLNITQNQKLVDKVKLLQSFKDKIQKQNKQLVQMVYKYMMRWVDGAQMETKHVEKMLIILFFIRNQKMYLSNGLNVKMSAINDKVTLINKINQVKQWEDYKYVNDKSIKLKVKQFLSNLIKQLQKQAEKQKQKQKQKQEPPVKVEKIPKAKQPKIQAIITEQNKKMQQKLQNMIKF